MTEELKEWALVYFKNRDLMLKKIENIKEEKDGFLISNNDGTSNKVKVEGFISDVDVVLNEFKDKTGTLVVYNNSDNLDILIDNWGKFIELKELNIIFTNPNSLQEKKWIINPYVHDKIVDPKSLRAGLISLFTTVDVVLKK